MKNFNKRLKNIFFEIFEIEHQSISKNISVDDIEDWDSLNHLNLIISLESEFQIEIPPRDFQLLYSNFDSIVKYLEKNIR